MGDATNGHKKQNAIVTPADHDRASSHRLTGSHTGRPGPLKIMPTQVPGVTPGQAV